MRTGTLAACWLVATIGCADKQTTIIPEDSGTTSTGGGTGGTEEGTDEDGDGFTLEDGDCDDTDYQVNPAWPEDPYDGKDNDCDGRVDEVWAGIAVAEQRGTARSAVVVFDSVGREDLRLTLPEDVVPWSVTQGHEDDWFVTGYPYFDSVSGPFSLASSGLVPSWDDSVPWYQPSTVYRLPESGGTEALAVFGDADYDACFALPEADVPDCFGELDPRLYFYGPYVRGIVAHPDGYLAVLTPGALYRVDPDGATTELAAWGWNLMAEPYDYELYGAGIDVDPATGTLGIAGLLGGFATYHADTGFEMKRPVDLSGDIDLDSLYTTVGLSWMDGDGWYSMSAAFTTGEYNVRRYDDATDDWTEEVRWIDDLLQPLGITTNGDEGDWYVTSKAGDYRVVFRVRGVDRSIDDFYREVADDYNLWGITNRW